MKDQYGNPVPTDLVLLPDFSDLTEQETDLIFRADWYECERVLMASFKAIGELSEDDPIDAGVDLRCAQVFKVDDCLKRGNGEDGFYHA